MNRQKCYITGQLIFGCDMVIPIKHEMDGELIRQQKQMKINKDNTRQKKHRLDYDYRVGDNVMLTKKLHESMRRHIKARL